jgi:hypothetical protein
MTEVGISACTSSVEFLLSKNYECNGNFFSCTGFIYPFLVIFVRINVEKPLISSSSNIESIVIF